MFEKGDYREITSDFRIFGITSLQNINEFQNKFEIHDTDTTINTIRDSIVANYLNYDLLNFAKHGFDAKNSRNGTFLEIKQCSLSSNKLGGTWNDTNEEKAKAFSDKRLFTVVAIWKAASDLQFMVYGQNVKMGEFLLKRVTNRKPGSRSTQTVSIEKLIKDFGFSVICPPDKNPESVTQIIVSYNRGLAQYVTIRNIREISDF